jgi:hypothetical protein
MREDDVRGTLDFRQKLHCRQIAVCHACREEGQQAEVKILTTPANLAGDIRSSLPVRWCAPTYEKTRTRPSGLSDAMTG